MFTPQLRAATERAISSAKLSAQGKMPQPIQHANWNLLPLKLSLLLIVSTLSGLPCFVYIRIKFRNAIRGMVPAK